MVVFASSFPVIKGLISVSCHIAVAPSVSVSGSRGALEHPLVCCRCGSRGALEHPLVCGRCGEGQPPLCYVVEASISLLSILRALKDQE